MNLGKWEIDDNLTFTCNTHDAATGAATDADSAPSYRVYEDETATPILTGSLALLDGGNTAGFYSEQIALTAANGFEVGKSYTIYISATVDSIVGTLSHSFQMEVEKASQASVDTIDGIVDAILVDTGTTLPAEHATLATAAALATVDGIVDAILVDTGTTLPAEHALLATSAEIAALNDLSSADVAAELATYDGPTRAEATADKDEILTVVDAILIDTGTTLPAEHALLATASDLATLDGKVDTVDSNVDAIKLVTDALPDGGALTTIDANIDAILVDTGTTLPAEHAALATAADLATVDANVDAILVDTGTTLPAEHALLATSAEIAALNDLSSADIQTIIETNDLDHLVKVAHPTGDPVADSLFDLIMNKDVSQTFDRADDSLEAISDGESTAPTAGEVADAVWDEAISGHTGGTTFGGKNQNQVPSETIGDYKADVSALASQASVDTIDTVVDAILVDTGTTLPAEHAALATAADLATVDANVDSILVDTGTTLPAEHAALATAADLATVDANVDSILVDTGTTLPAAIAALNDLSSADIQTVIETNDLDHLAKVAHPTGDPTIGSLIDFMMNKDSGQTFDQSTDSLEALAASVGLTAEEVANAVWDEAAGDHTTSTTFGGKNQNNVPSETLNDYKADVSALATAAALATVDTVVDAIKAVTDNLPDSGSLNDLAGIKAVTDNLPDSGALTTIDSNVDAILVDTGTTLPAQISALNDLAAADIQTVLETNDLDHLLKVAHPTGDPVADSILDLVMNKDGSQTFDRSTDALEAISEAGGGSTPAAIADAVWDELIAGHVGAGSFGETNQLAVPSATLADYKADVSGLATAAALATTDGKVDTIDTVVDAIKAVTDLIPDAGAMNDLAAILVDTGTTLPAEHALLATAADLAVVDANVDAILVDTGTTIPGSLATIDANVDAILVDTGTTLPITLSDIIADIDDVSEDLEDHDTDIKADLSDLSDDIADVKTDTETIIAAVGGIPVGAITFIYNVTNQVSGNPIGDADVWVTTDSLGNNAVASGKTDAFGNVTFYLDAGVYYFWTQKSGFNFENPDTEEVS